MASSLETNKILAALLTAGIFASGAGVMSRIIYHPTAPEEPAYVIEVAAESEGGGGDEGGGEEMSVLALLSSADLAGGESGAKKCAACHSFDEGGENKIGPGLWGIVGRDIGSVSGFAYSEALAGVEGDWTYEALDGFLADPKGWAPGTKMAYAGMRGAEDRADLIVYLRSISPDAPPLPEAEAAPEETAAEETEGAESEGETAAAAEGEAAGGSEGTAAAAESVADAAADAAEEVAEEAGDAAEEVAEAASDVVDGAEETVAAATEAADEAVDDAVASAEETAEDAAKALAGAAESTADDATDVAAAVEETGDGAAMAAAGAASGLVAMIADADVAKGEKVAKKCKACHVFDEGGKNKLGPALWDVVNRDIGSHDGYKYSAALQEMEGGWTYEKLDQFLAAPKEWAPGTKMVFAGVKKEQDRADLIAYLRSLAAEPAPLEGGDG